MCLCHPILITYEYTSFPPLRRPMRAHEISGCLLGQPSQMSIYVGGTVAISLFSKLSVYAGGVAGNVGLCGVNFAFFQNSQSMRGVSVEFLDLCGVSLVLFSLIVIISKGASHEFSVSVRPSVGPCAAPSLFLFNVLLMCLCHPILITYEYTPLPPLWQPMWRRGFSRCPRRQPSKMSVYVGGAAAISLFSKLSVYAGGVAGNVDRYVASIFFFSKISVYAGGVGRNSRPMWCQSRSIFSNRHHRQGGVA